ncbi:chondroitin AC/alginate lyase [Aspergillus pseudoustus]|uniref:Chondroitin AC/alginate lyase n=1 Tax=Aspergillus pseudoustus TaxID=1810923 RepID=A0ABR4J5Y6_9EURO
MRLSFICPLLAFCLRASAWTHPGLLVTDLDIARIQAKLSAEKEPWVSAWAYFESLSFSSSSYTAGAVSDIDRNTNGEVLWHDAAAAFNLALRWRVTQEDEYAEAAAAILAAWGETLTTFSGGDDRYLSAGLQGYELANAAELLRDYAPFVAEGGGWDAFVDMAVNVILPLNIAFLNHEEPSEHNVLHFFANWELAQVASIQAISVLTENATAWKFAFDYFKGGNGNGAIGNAIAPLVEEPDTGVLLGQGQESGRDQGHSALDQQLLAAIGQQAWNQGEDLFALNDSLILHGAEYFARYNLGHDVPFEPYTNGIVSYTDISSASRGATRPTWELLYAHYVQIKGLDAPWTEAYLNYTLESFGGVYEKGIGYGEGSGHYDGVGWGTLLYRLEESDLEDIQQGATTTSSQAVTSSPTPSPSSTVAASSSVSAPSVSPSVVTSATATDTTTSVATLVVSDSTVTSINPSVSTTTSVATEYETSKPTSGHSHSHSHGHHHHDHPSGGHCKA